MGSSEVQGIGVYPHHQRADVTLLLVSKAQLGSNLCQSGPRLFISHAGDAILHPVITASFTEGIGTTQTRGEGMLVGAQEEVAPCSMPHVAALEKEVLENKQLYDVHKMLPK